MRVICKINHEKLSGARFESLIAGEQYIVYGVMAINNRIEFLVCPDSNGPAWVSSVFFDISDNRLPAWRWCVPSTNENFNQLFEQFDIKFLISYDQLTESYEHYAGILERNKEQLIRFFQIKLEIDAISTEI